MILTTFKYLSENNRYSSKTFQFHNKDAKYIMQKWNDI
jgi:hypothetical protein